jgi:hypothetical protein
VIVYFQNKFYSDETADNFLVITLR